VSLENNKNPYFSKIQSICLKFILTCVNKFSRSGEWYLNNFMEGLNEEDVVEHEEQFFEDPYFHISE